MNAADFFTRIQLHHIDRAVEYEPYFPRDSLELARVILRAVALVEQDIDVGAASLPLDEAKLTNLIDRRIDALTILEQRRLAEEGLWEEDDSSTLN